MDESRGAFSGLVTVVREQTKNDFDVIRLLQKRFNKATPSYIISETFRTLVNTTKKRLITRKENTYVVVKEFATELKAYENKDANHTDYSSGKRTCDSKSESECESIPPNKRRKQDSEIVSSNKGESNSTHQESVDKETEVDKKAKKLEKHAQKLEKLLELVTEEIKKLEAKEISLDELDDESTYTLLDRYKKKSVKIWKRLCKVRGRSSLCGRVTETKFRYDGTKYTQLNHMIEKFVNKYKEFPDYTDIVEIVEKCNQKYRLKIKKRMQEMLAKDIFTEVGNKLQERRHQDLIQNFGSFLTDNTRMMDDPALYDRELKAKLEKNQVISKSNLESVIKKYAYKQEQDGDATDDEDEEDGGEEEDTEEDRIGHVQTKERDKIPRASSTISKAPASPEQSSDAMPSFSSRSPTPSPVPQRKSLLSDSSPDRHQSDIEMVIRSDDELHELEKENEHALHSNDDLAVQDLKNGDEISDGERILEPDDNEHGTCVEDDKISIQQNTGELSSEGDLDSASENSSKKSSKSNCVQQNVHSSCATTLLDNDNSVSHNEEQLVSRKKLNCKVISKSFTANDGAILANRKDESNSIVKDTVNVLSDDEDFCMDENKCSSTVNKSNDSKHVTSNNSITRSKIEELHLNVLTPNNKEKKEEGTNEEIADDVICLEELDTNISVSNNEEKKEGNKEQNGNDAIRLEELHKSVSVPNNEEKKEGNKEENSNDVICLEEMARDASKEEENYNGNCHIADKIPNKTAVSTELVTPNILDERDRINDIENSVATEQKSSKTQSDETFTSNGSANMIEKSDLENVNSASNLTRGVPQPVDTTNAKSKSSTTGASESDYKYSDYIKKIVSIVEKSNSENVHNASILATVIPPTASAASTTNTQSISSTTSASKGPDKSKIDSEEIDLVILDDSEPVSSEVFDDKERNTNPHTKTNDISNIVAMACKSAMTIKSSINSKASKSNRPFPGPAKGLMLLQGKCSTPAKSSTSLGSQSLQLSPIPIDLDTPEKCHSKPSNGLKLNIPDNLKNTIRRVVAQTISKQNPSKDKTKSNRLYLSISDDDDDEVDIDIQELKKKTKTITNSERTYSISDEEMPTIKCLNGKRKNKVKSCATNSNSLSTSSHSHKDQLVSSAITKKHPIITNNLQTNQEKKQTDNVKKLSSEKQSVILLDSDED